MPIIEVKDLRDARAARELQALRDENANLKIKNEALTMNLENQNRKMREIMPRLDRLVNSQYEMQGSLGEFTKKLVQARRALNIVACEQATKKQMVAEARKTLTLIFGSETK